MKKYGMMLVLMMLFFQWQPHLGYGATPSETGQTSFDVQTQLEALETDDIRQLLQELDQEMQPYLSGSSLTNFFQGIISGELHWSLAEFMQGLLGMFKHEIALNVNIVGKLIFLAIASAVLNNLHTAFVQENISKLANLVLIFVVILLLMTAIEQVLTLGKTVVLRMVQFMQLLLPIQLVLMASLGSVTSVSLLQPSLYFLVNVIGNLFHYLVFPLIYFEVILKIVNNLSDEFKIDQLAGVFKSVILAVVSISSTVFLALLSVQGLGGAVVDGLSLRTAKYVAGAFVPVVGGMLSDIMETMVGGSLLIKNAFGILGLLAILVITLLPAIKIFVIYLLYKFTAAIIQPLGDTKVVALINDTGNSFLLVFVAVIFVAIMFFFTIVIITITANFAVMLR